MCFCLVGGGSSQLVAPEEHLRLRVESEGLSGYVRLLGRSNNVAGLLPHFCIFVLTSDWEGCPNVVIEAMRAQLPVVMTDCTDTELLIEQGQSGYVVPRGDAGAMARRVDELLDDMNKRQQFGQRGWELAKKNFDATANAWLLARIYINEWERANCR